MGGEDMPVRRANTNKIQGAGDPEAGALVKKASFV